MSTSAVIAPSALRYSRAARVERLGEELVAALEREARSAPPASPELVERLRLIFACPAGATAP